MSIFSKAWNKIKKVGKKVVARSVAKNKPKVQASVSKWRNVLKSAMKKAGQQPAAVFQARIGEGMTPKQTATAYQKIATSNVLPKTLLGQKFAQAGVGKTARAGQISGQEYAQRTSNALIAKGKNVPKFASPYGEAQGDYGMVNLARSGAIIPRGDTALANITETKPMITPTGEITGTTPLAKSYAPSSTSGITSMGTPSLGTTPTVLGNIDNAKAGLAGNQTWNDQQIKLGEEYNAALQPLEQNKQSWMEKMLGEQQSQAQLRQDLSEQYGIKAQQDAINSLQQSYNAVVQTKDNQIMATQDKMGSMNFINNQVAQINRNAAPEINRLAGEINFKTGILTQNQELVQQAIQDYNADKKQRLDMYAMFMDDNQDDIKNLRADYKDALDRGWQEAKFDYQNGVKEKQDIADLALKYTKAGITLNDSWETAVMKAQKNPYTTSQLLSMAKGSEESEETESSFLDIMQINIDAGFSPEESAREAAAYSEQMGIPVDQKTLNLWIQQARKLKKGEVPLEVQPEKQPNWIERLQANKAKARTAESTFFSNLFS